MRSTMLKDADPGQICLRSSTSLRSDSFDTATSAGTTDSAARLDCQICGSSLLKSPYVLNNIGKILMAVIFFHAIRH